VRTAKLDSVRKTIETVAAEAVAHGIIGNRRLAGSTDGSTMHSPTRRHAPWALFLATASILLSPWSSAVADSSSAYTPEVTARFERAAQLFEQARAGSAAAVAPAQDAFKELLQTEASNPLFIAYYGSTFAMRARDGGAPWQKIRWVNEGVDNIDRALALLGPQDDAKTLRGVSVALETRLVAIATYIPLPALFNRMSVARQQLTVAMSSPSFDRASNELRGRFYYEDALVARADGDSEHERRALREVVKDAPPSLNMNEVRAELAKLGG
jgi:hypothetical protein